MRLAPFYFLYGGRVRSSVADAVGRVGDYWSNTTYSSQLSYRLDFYLNIVLPSHFNNRYDGFSIRCLAR